jgi:ArsR family transcriptional regulator
MKKDLSEFHAEVCKTFAHSKRLEILNILKTGELTASEITKELGATKANTSQHLALMRMRGILKTRRDGTNIYYRMANENLAHACTLMQEALAQITEDAGSGRANQGRLDRFNEGLLQ